MTTTQKIILANAIIFLLYSFPLIIRVPDFIRDASYMVALFFIHFIALLFAIIFYSTKKDKEVSRGLWISFALLLLGGFSVCTYTFLGGGLR